MVLRGQGDSPVRICEPCKNLEEAARFELRHGNKSRAGKAFSAVGSKISKKSEDEILSQILHDDGKDSSASGHQSHNGSFSSTHGASSWASSSNIQEASTHDGGREISRSHSADEPNFLQNEMGSASPEELRQQALDEKKKYKILKGEGKPEDALKAFKRGKELERQAEAMEILIRKRRRKVTPSDNMTEIQDKEGSIKGSGRNRKPLPQLSNKKDDFTAELRELGWSDMDIRDQDKKPGSTSLEDEKYSLAGDISQSNNKKRGPPGIDKTQVIEHKKKALALKREGKLVEAKEELKKAKVLEKQLEEQELLAEAEDSDDEISALIRSMDDDEKSELSNPLIQEQHFDIDHFMGATDDIGLESNFEVTDEDTEDPEIAADLKSLGWTDDSDNLENVAIQSVAVNRETLLSEILSLKREALSKKRAGNVAEAMLHLKKAKLLERDLENLEPQTDNVMAGNSSTIQKSSSTQTADKMSMPPLLDDGNIRGVDFKSAAKSRVTIQKELLNLKKKALTLRREGRFDEAEEELNKGKVLEHQLEEMDTASKMKVVQMTVDHKGRGSAYEHSVISQDLPVSEDGEDITDQDMHDPTYLSLLKSLGWNDGPNEPIGSTLEASMQNDRLSRKTSKTSSSIASGASKRTKAEIQRELLGLRRKALALRREGKADEAEEMLIMSKALEEEMAEMNEQKEVESYRPGSKIEEPPFGTAIEEIEEEDVTETDFKDPAMLTMLKNLGWKDEEFEPLTRKGKPSEEVAGGSSSNFTDSFINQSYSSNSMVKRRSKGEIQRELLALKRKALAHRRKGEIEEAEECLKMGKVLEAQMNELVAPKGELQLDSSEENKSLSFKSLTILESRDNMKDDEEVHKESAKGSINLNDRGTQSSTELGIADSDAVDPLLRNSNDLIPLVSSGGEDIYPLTGELGHFGEMGHPRNVVAAEGSGLIHPPVQSANLMDLLTGDDWKNSQIPATKLESRGNIVSNISSVPTEPTVEVGSMRSINADTGSKGDVTTGKREVMVYEEDKPLVNEAKSVQGHTSQNHQNALRQTILSHKKAAVALKREGKLTEALEELKQAKLLEKSSELDNPEKKTDLHDMPASTSNAPLAGRTGDGTLNLAPKPAAGRDRFKLQQESLSHKRQALKLRREGRIQEAEAEFELAKALEAQLEESAAHEPSKPSASGAGLVDDVVIEDFLDPQLLSALKGLGLEDPNTVPQAPARLQRVKDRPEPVKPSVGKNENHSQERIQLEEQIKAEKLKALNLKRSGKQSEALDAFRRAKLLERKLNLLASN
ncbi:uncharacterized protein LOC120004975 isoform X1 [Tripterygium wilfordii]|nr:uncharacterized protein LOC120004975 isoform X1 [Tripterygium wilfordii]